MLVLEITHVIIAILLGASILLQQRGSGLGDAFGDTSVVYTSRRGTEKVLYYFSIIFGIAFVALALLQLYIANK